MEPESSGASGILQLQAPAWVNTGFMWTGNETGACAPAPEAGFSTLGVTQSWWGAFSVELG